MLKKITILGGLDKDGHTESIQRLDILPGQVLAVAGPTGSDESLHPLVAQNHCNLRWKNWPAFLSTVGGNHSWPILGVQERFNLIVRAKNFSLLQLAIKER
jgi:hypothetical protein